MNKIFFKNNGFPTKIIKNQIGKFINSKYSGNKNKENAENPIHFKLPYLVINLKNWNVNNLFVK